MLNLAFFVLFASMTACLALEPPRSVELHRRGNDTMNQDFVMISSVGFNHQGAPLWARRTFNDSNVLDNNAFISAHLVSILNATCSIEMLSVLWLKSVVKKINKRDLNAAYAGSSVFTFSNDDLSFSVVCYHRSLFQTWWRPIQSFATPILCPFHEQSLCDDLDILSHTPSIDTTIQTVFVFQGYVNFSRHIELTANIYPIQINDSRTDVAVCTALPYVASDEETRVIQQRLLLDFIAYYSRLNITTFVYDRYGQHYDPSFALETNQPYLKYYNYTVGQYVMDEDRLNSYSDEDKAMTFNHCRFEARVVFGIHNVIVSDSDEFLYCHNYNSATTQRHTINQIFADQELFDEVGGIMTHPSTRADSFEDYVDCVITAAHSNRTLFPCFSTLYKRKHLTHTKTIYVGMKCPITSFHQGCFPKGIGICSECSLGDSRHLDCNFIHLATSTRSRVKLRNSSREDTVLELQTIMEID